MTREVSAYMFSVLHFVFWVGLLCPASAGEPTRYSSIPSEHALEVIRKAIESGQIPRLHGYQKWEVPSDFYTSGAWSGPSNMLVFAAVMPRDYRFLEPSNLIEFVPALAATRISNVIDQLRVPTDPLKSAGHKLVFVLNGLLLSTVDFSIAEGMMFIEADASWQKTSKPIPHGTYEWDISPAGIYLWSEIGKREIFRV